MSMVKYIGVVIYYDGLVNKDTALTEEPWSSWAGIMDGYAPKTPPKLP
jgi:hypothetical protein